MKVQLLSFEGCPHVEATRQRLIAALGQLNLAIDVEEVDLRAATTPEGLRRWASPTVLIDGRDLEGREAGSDACESCRIYDVVDGGGPALSLIISALRRHARPRSSWLAAVAALPASLSTLLPVMFCPACLGGYGAALSALGIGGVTYSRWASGAMTALLAASIALVAWDTRRHQSPWPLALTVLGTVAAMSGRFVLANEALQRLAFPLLLAGSIWSIYLNRRLIPRRGDA